MMDDEMGTGEYELDDAASEHSIAHGLGTWVEDHYAGDSRFEIVTMDEPGQLGGENFRVRFVVSEATHFLVALMSEEGFIRVGVATESEPMNEHIESEVLEAGLSFTEFLAEAIGTEEELDYEVQQFHDDIFYFCSDIGFEHIGDLSLEATRDEVIYYLEGFVEGFGAIVGATHED